MIVIQSNLLSQLAIKANAFGLTLHLSPSLLAVQASVRLTFEHNNKLLTNF